MGTEVTEFVKASQVRQSPKEGVFVHGLFLDAAGWDMSEGTLVESEPKVLYAALPILWVTGVTKATAKSRSGDYGPYGGYECPCYKYPNRGDRYLVFYVTLLHVITGRGIGPFAARRCFAARNNY